MEVVMPSRIQLICSVLKVLLKAWWSFNCSGIFVSEVQEKFISSLIISVWTWHCPYRLLLCPHFVNLKNIWQIYCFPNMCAKFDWIIVNYFPDECLHLSMTGCQSTNAHWKKYLNVMQHSINNIVTGTSVSPWQVKIMNSVALENIWSTLFRAKTWNQRKIFSV